MVSIFYQNTTGAGTCGPRMILAFAALIALFTSGVGSAQEAPTVLSVQPATTGPTNDFAVDFQVTFSEAVTGFDEDLDLNIQHNGTSHLEAIISGGPTIYSVSVRGVGGNGTFTLSVQIDSGVEDLDGFPLASTQTSGAVLMDNRLPVVTLNLPEVNSVTQFGLWADPGATATDTLDGEIPVEVSGDTVNSERLSRSCILPRTTQATPPTRSSAPSPS